MTFYISCRRISHETTMWLSRSVSPEFLTRDQYFNHSLQYKMVEWRHFFRRNIARNNQIAIQSTDINPRVEQEVRRGRYAHRFYSRVSTHKSPIFRPCCTKTVAGALSEVDLQKNYKQASLSCKFHKLLTIKVWKNTQACSKGRKSGIFKIYT